MWLRIFVVNEPLLLWGHLLEELDPHDMLMPSANRCTKYMTYPPLPSGSSTGKSPTSAHWLLWQPWVGRSLMEILYQWTPWKVDVNIYICFLLPNEFPVVVFNFGGKQPQTSPERDMLSSWTWAIGPRNVSSQLILCFFLLLLRFGFRLWAWNNSFRLTLPLTRPITLSLALALASCLAPRVLSLWRLLMVILGLPDPLDTSTIHIFIHVVIFHPTFEESHLLGCAS